jgi:peptide/nickel transport system substrate-binding protein
MNRRDQAVLAGLVSVIVLVAISLGLPEAIAPAPPATPLPATAAPARPYVEGLPGPLEQISPLSARSQAERNAVALVFSGLVRLGPGDTIVPDLAESWTVDASGTHWTFRLRPDAFWHDGAQVTADDIVFTVNVLKNDSYSGPGGSSWKEATATAVDRLTVRFDLVTPLGGFLVAATQPIVPRHVLDGIPVSVLSSPTSSFGRQPVGSGPYRVAEMTPRRVELVPAGRSGLTSTSDPGRGAATPSPPVDAIRTDAPPLIPPRLTSTLKGIEFRLFDDAEQVAAAWTSGELDGASGLTPTLNARLAAQPHTRLIRYPGSTLMAVVLDLRPAHPEFRDANVRRALLAAIDRDALVSKTLAGYGVRADAPIPPSSWAFDPVATVPVGHDAAAATSALQAAGWVRAADGWRRSGTQETLVTELLSAEEDANPIAYGMAAAVVDDWKALGLAVTHVALPPAELTSTRLRAGDFDAVLLSVNVGLDPDLYPLLASTQTTTTGSNIAGLQDAALDKLLVAARGPGAFDARKAAYAALQQQLTAGTYLLPLAFRDVVVVASDRLSGPTPRTLGDPADRFWDVLTWRLAVDR